MGVGTKRGKGDRGQFEALERIYTVTAQRDRPKLQGFIDALKGQNGPTAPTTCDELRRLTSRLGPDEVEAVNANWYGRGRDGKPVRAHWFHDSELNPAQIQLVNRAATIHALERLLALGEEHGDVSLQMWGQCNHPRFFIEVLEFSSPSMGDATAAQAPYLVMDYYVPYNVGYGTPFDDPRRYPLPADPPGYHPADPAKLRWTDDGLGRLRFEYDHAAQGQR